MQTGQTCAQCHLVTQHDGQDVIHARDTWVDFGLTPVGITRTIRGKQVWLCSLECFGRSVGYR
jgi:hypothetical protein